MKLTRKTLFGSFLLALLLASTAPSRTQISALKTYRSSRPKFTLKYPANKKIHEWPDGVSVLSGKWNVIDLFRVSNNAFPSGHSEYARTAGRFFRRLQNVKPGNVIIG